MDSFVENNVKALRERIGDGKVLCALSGGVDSSVLAAMLAKAIGKQLTCVFVDHGLLRKNEKEEVCSVFGPGNANGFDINFICVDARDRYFSKLKGVTEPERKRKIIGEEFIRVFEEEDKQSKLKGAKAPTKKELLLPEDAQERLNRFLLEISMEWLKNKNGDCTWKVLKENGQIVIKPVAVAKK